MNQLVFYKSIRDVQKSVIISNFTGKILWVDE